MNEPVTSTCLDLEEVLLLTTAQLQQEEANKTFLLSRMQSATLGLTDAEAAAIPF